MYLEQTTSGVDTSLLFEIPDSCSPSGEFSHSSWIEWNLSVEGKLSGDDMPRFEHDWQIIVGNQAAHASNLLSIPQSFIQNYEQRSENRAKTSDLEKMLVTEDGQSIDVHRIESSLQPFFKLMRVLKTLFRVVFISIVVIVCLISARPEMKPTVVVSCKQSSVYHILSFGMTKHPRCGRRNLTHLSQPRYGLFLDGH